MREALQYKNLIPKSKVAERKTLQAFDNNPVTILGQFTEDDKDKHPYLNYQKRNQWVKAFDFYVYKHICNDNKYGYWWNISECCQELGEYHLAKLFLFCGAVLRSDLSRTDFFKLEKEINKLLKQQTLFELNNTTE